MMIQALMIGFAVGVLTAGAVVRWVLPWARWWWSRRGLDRQLAELASRRADGHGKPSEAATSPGS